MTTTEKYKDTALIFIPYWDMEEIAKGEWIPPNLLWQLAYARTYESREC